MAHTGVCVPDLAAAVRWYTQTLGLAVLSPPARVEGRAIESDMAEMIPGVVLAAAILGVGDSGDRVLEVIEYPKHPGRPNRDFLTRGIAEIAGLETTWFEDPYGNVFILMEKSAPRLPYFRQWAANAR